MGRMSPEQRRELHGVLGRVYTAAPELVHATVLRARIERADMVHDAVPPIARNLLEAETELAALRTVVAQLIVGNDHGHDHSLADLRQAVKAAGIDLTPEYTAADALARAQESETR